MAQVTSQTVANGSGASVRSNMNNIFGALFSSNSGATAPTTTVAGQLWFDTGSSPAVLKVRNAANDGWVEVDPANTAPTETRLTSGTGTYNPPAGCIAIDVEMKGPGGGGGGADGQGSGTAAAAGGGGEGGYLRKLIASPAASWDYTVGSSGAGGAAGNNSGSAGTASTFDDNASVTLTANPGGGGAGSAGSSGSGSALGGTGGTATGGDINIAGARAATARRSGGQIASFGDGAGSILGAGAVHTTSGAGPDAANGYGAGGAGATSVSTSTNYAGGDGTGGIIIIREFY